MDTSIKTRIVKIGNFQGLRISKTLLEQSGIKSEVEIEVQENHLIIRPVEQARKDWEKAFIEMAENRDDILLDDINTTEWDKAEWQW
ncbi:AbrB/MazE/SpoVT family DNA-binding domain-containing protein [Anabaena cylindrica FACHB-243]|uniref:SpoVT/AbrB domain-containing protein n=1 Tax=Anabaena cylindrica (strain ATCC 27899 / PCC 7122) TaxID=272123 RepID=K9ZQ30_ANACC|nr:MULTISPECIES: AbrB/MazE/SpoVT family DNA-binding domain-containing protein [Anabaena]AFZ60460.1 SpoVT/AbrB domain-containing protein [Anabaena cylindrica PCC 7122]MBD2416446.1 AbrB/MazE/SpoVT family DNA-binding domain-containing protein [Anabaena cylindrica FACHB-243]MBY5284842.1 AbrB/MazE/SpoVT family DNA-binding domain-containing protein [Anabaena sp. CCAP 1446/1C]MBY5310374.1 AbrB/MazE/SpoVT family DNA-binding domain-containing protein [Anabaena sp. CCAP 1446/1C]MCM2408499.1 AbrB/MazE/Sp